MIIKPFKKEHLDVLRLQEGQKFFYKLIQEKSYKDFLEKHYTSWSLIDDNTWECYACFGYLDRGYGRHEVWALLGENSGRYLRRLTRLIEERFSEFDGIRVEMVVEDGFKAAHRWAKMLGFKCETPQGMLNYVEDTTYYLYARVL